MVGTRSSIRLCRGRASTVLSPVSLSSTTVQPISHIINNKRRRGENVAQNYSLSTHVPIDADKESTLKNTNPVTKTPSVTTVATLRDSLIVLCQKLLDEFKNVAFGQVESLSHHKAEKGNQSSIQDSNEPGANVFKEPFITPKSATKITPAIAKEDYPVIDTILEKAGLEENFIPNDVINSTCDLVNSKKRVRKQPTSNARRVGLRKNPPLPPSFPQRNNDDIKHQENGSTLMTASQFGLSGLTKKRKSTEVSNTFTSLNSPTKSLDITGGHTPLTSSKISPTPTRNETKIHTPLIASNTDNRFITDTTNNSRQQSDSFSNQNVIEERDLKFENILNFVVQTPEINNTNQDSGEIFEDRDLYIRQKGSHITYSSKAIKNNIFLHNEENDPLDPGIELKVNPPSFNENNINSRNFVSKTEFDANSCDIGFMDESSFNSNKGKNVIEKTAEINFINNITPKNINTFGKITNIRRRGRGLGAGLKLPSPPPFPSVPGNKHRQIQKNQPVNISEQGPSQSERLKQAIAALSSDPYTIETNLGSPILKLDKIDLGDFDSAKVLFESPVLFQSDSSLLTSENISNPVTASSLSNSTISGSSTSKGGHSNQPSVNHDISNLSFSPTEKFVVSPTGIPVWQQNSKEIFPIPSMKLSPAAGKKSISFDRTISSPLKHKLDSKIFIPFSSLTCIADNSNTKTELKNNNTSFTNNSDTLNPVSSKNKQALGHASTAKPKLPSELFSASKAKLESLNSNPYSPKATVSRERNVNGESMAISNTMSSNSSRTASQTISKIKNKVAALLSSSTKIMEATNSFNSSPGNNKFNTISIVPSIISIKPGFSNSNITSTPTKSFGKSTPLKTPLNKKATPLSLKAINSSYIKQSPIMSSNLMKFQQSPGKTPITRTRGTKQSECNPIWTISPHLKKHLLAQSWINPESIFGSMQDLSLEQMFPANSRRLQKPRGSSAVWDGSDALTEYELQVYNQTMGYNLNPDLGQK